MSEFPEQDVRAIQDIHHRWLSVERKGNPVGVLQWCTEDVRWIPPDSPLLAGKEAIRKWLESDKVEIKSLEVANLQIRGSGSLAYKTGDYSTSYVEPHSSGDLSSQRNAPVGASQIAGPRMESGCRSLELNRRA